VSAGNSGLCPPIQINLPLEKGLANGGAEAIAAPWAVMAQASHFDVKTPLAGETPLTPMPPVGGNF
jgi:hypothetical protein